MQKNNKSNYAIHKQFQKDNHKGTIKDVSVEYKLQKRTLNSFKHENRFSVITFFEVLKAMGFIMSRTRFFFLKAMNFFLVGDNVIMSSTIQFTGFDSHRS